MCWISTIWRKMCWISFFLMGKRGAHKEKIQLINSSCVYAYIRNRKHARTKNGSGTDGKRASVLTGASQKYKFFEDASKFFDRRFIFFLVLCCSSSEKTARFTFGSQFWNIFLSLFNVRGKCGTRGCALVEFASKEEARSLKVLSSALFCCFFFRKKRFLFQRERELFSVL